MTATGRITTARLAPGTVVLTRGDGSPTGRLADKGTARTVAEVNRVDASTRRHVVFQDGTIASTYPATSWTLVAPATEPRTADDKGATPVTATITPAKTQLAQQLMEHATAHYNDGGWDVLVETSSIEEVAQRLADAKVRTLAGAIAAYATEVSIWAEREADAAIEGATEPEAPADAVVLVGGTKVAEVRHLDAKRAAKAAKAPAKGKAAKAPAKAASAAKAPAKAAARGSVASEYREGYVVILDRKGYQVVRRAKDVAEGPLYLAICTAHLDEQAADSGRDAHVLGMDRALWCTGCLADAEAAKAAPAEAAPAKAPAKAAKGKAKA